MPRPLVIVVALISLAVAIPGGAAGVSQDGFSYRIKQSEVKRGESKTVKVPCPRAMHVWGGGAASDSQYRDATYNGIPYDGDDKGKAPDDGWRARVTNKSGEKLPIIGEAVCSSNLRPKYLSASEKVPPHTQSSVAVDCPDGGDAVGGGMSGKVAMNSSFPGSDGNWDMFADNYTGRKQTVKSYVTCVNDNGVHLYSNFIPGSASPNGPTNQSATQATGCLDSDTLVVGGGVSNSGSFGEIAMRNSEYQPGSIGFTVDNLTSNSISSTLHVLCYLPD